GPRSGLSKAVASGGSACFSRASPCFSFGSEAPECFRCFAALAGSSVVVGTDFAGETKESGIPFGSGINFTSGAAAEGTANGLSSLGPATGFDLLDSTAFVAVSVGEGLAGEGLAGLTGGQAADCSGGGTPCDSDDRRPSACEGSGRGDVSGPGIAGANGSPV